MTNERGRSWVRAGAGVVLALLGACAGPSEDASGPSAPPVIGGAEGAAEPAVPTAAPVPPAAPAPSWPDVHLSRFGEGAGPARDGDTFRLLDAARTKGQSNAVAFDLAAPGARQSVRVRCRMCVLEGGDGGAFVLLATAAHGARGPAPFVANWTEPNLRGSFAVGIDVHDPKDEEPFGPWGNYQGLPEREVSLHWDGREIVKRVAPAEFRGDFADFEIAVDHVVGGAEVTVTVAGAKTYDRHFVAGMHPYESRLAVGAGTRADAATEFDVRDVRVEAGPPAPPHRPPVRVEVFHHVRTDNSRTAFEAEVDLPPAEWEFGRVVLDLEIHDAGNAWDEWDRNGEVSLWDRDGVKRGIVPFITSYRTPCRWQVDVTHFRPWLAGRTRFEVAAGTNFYKNRGYQMSVSLEFHHGRPERDAFRIVPLWNGIARYRSDENHFRDFFGPVTAEIDAAATDARLFVTTTGHSQVGEFTPSEREVVFVPDASASPPREVRFANTLWKADCYLNPNRPQFGTWKFSRAGWAPGDVVHPWWIDLTPHLAAGRTASFRYEPRPYDFAGAPEAPDEKARAEAIHVVRSYLVLSRPPGALVPAPTVRIVNVAEDSRAARAGIREGDWLASYDGRPIGSVDDLRAAIGAAETAKKTAVPVVVWRGAERLSFDVPPGRLGVALR